MIVVAGEALVDVVVAGDGQVSQHLGGGAFNTARAVGRLAQPVSFLGRVSRDPIGQSLRMALSEAGVSPAGMVETDDPTTRAIAELDPAGSARYRFEPECTSVPGLELGDARKAMTKAAVALQVGGLGLVFEPQASAIATLVEEVPERTLIILYPYCPSEAVASLDRYLERIGAVMRRADVVKTKR